MVPYVARHRRRRLATWRVWPARSARSRSARRRSSAPNLAFVTRRRPRDDGCIRRAAAGIASAAAWGIAMVASRWIDPMTHEFVTLSAQDPDSAVTCDRGVSLVPAAERRLHSPDATLLLDRSRLARGAMLLLVDRHGAARRPSRRRHRPLRGRRRGLGSRAALAGVRPAWQPAARRPWSVRWTAPPGAATGSSSIVAYEPPFFLEPDNPDEWPDIGRARVLRRWRPTHPR